MKTRDTSLLSRFEITIFLISLTFHELKNSPYSIEPILECLSLMLVIAFNFFFFYCALVPPDLFIVVVVVVVPSGLGGGRNGPCTHFLPGKGPRESTIVRETMYYRPDILEILRPSLALA